MYKRILVAIDESATSDLALREAINLAKDQNAALRLVHVVDLTPVSDCGDTLPVRGMPKSNGRERRKDTRKSCHNSA